MAEKKKAKEDTEEKLSSKIEFSVIEDVDVEKFFTRKFKTQLRKKYERVEYGILAIVPSKTDPHVHMLFSPPRDMIPGRAKGLVVISFKPIRRNDLKGFVKEIEKLK